MSNLSIDFNVAAHDKIAERYERLHTEIYNEYEQERLRIAIVDAVHRLAERASRPVVLDYGCGSGNLTRKFVNAGCNVIASDVSTEFLRIVSNDSDPTKVSTLQLNGVDLREIETASIDIVATYSVLHHIPDYLKIVEEFARIVKPGGIIFIDHEKSSGYWESLEEFRKIYRLMVPFPKRMSKFFRAENYKTWFVRRFVDPSYSPEGDIHVYPHDHIDWDKIDTLLLSEGFNLVRSEEYLLFRGDYLSEKYEIYRDRLTDMRLLIAQKSLAF